MSNRKKRYYARIFRLDAALSKMRERGVGVS